MEKITITPNRIRGLSNVLNPRSIDDFERYYSRMIESDDLFRLTSSVYHPPFDGSDEVIKQFTDNNAYSASDGVARFKGAVLAEGWDNTGLWECSFELAYLDGLRYTGLILLTNTSTPFSGWGIRNWEGPIAGNPISVNGGTYTKTPDINLTDRPDGVNLQRTNPIIEWHTVNMNKTSSTTLEVWKNDDTSNKVVYEWSELSDVPRVTIGGAENGASKNEYGSTFIRNLFVEYIE